MTEQPNAVSPVRTTTGRPPRPAPADGASRRRRRTRHLLDILHFVCSVGWLGVGLSQLVANLVALNSGDVLLQHHVHELAHIFDRWLLIPVSLGAAVTGVLLALRTRWKLTRHWWVLAKLTLTTALLVFSPVWMGGWILTAIDATTGTTAHPGYGEVRSELITGSAGISLMLLAMVVISVVKPWGRTPWSHRPGRSAG